MSATDPLKKVQPGDELEIPAQTFNTFIDAAQHFKHRQHAIGRDPRPEFRQTGIVLVQNDSGEDRDRFDVLGIDGPIITPAENAVEFKNRVALKGITPAADDHAGKFVILTEPAAAGKIVPAYIDGVCPARVDVTDEDHTYADVDDGDAGQLATALHGAARILWKEDGTGIVWAIVRLGPGEFARWAKVESGYDWEENSGDPRVWCKLCDRDGTNVRGDGFWLYLPRVRGESDDYDPEVYEDDVLPWELDDEGTPISRYGYRASKVGDIRMQKANAKIRTGWREMDGSGEAWDMKGRAPFGRNPDVGDENDPGDAVGFRWHGADGPGEGDNNHPDHKNHSHRVHTGSSDTDMCDDVENLNLHVYDADGEVWTTGVDQLKPVTDGTDFSNHLGPFNANKDTDNRGPRRGVIMVERYK